MIMLNKRLLPGDTVSISVFPVCLPLLVLNADSILGVTSDRAKLKNDDNSSLFGILFECKNLSKSDLLVNMLIFTVETFEKIWL